MLSVHAVAGNVAHSGSGAVPKTCSNDVGDVGPHGDIIVDVNTKVPNSSDQWHQNITNTNRCSWDQMLTSRWGATEDLGLGEIQLQSICLHPRWNLTDADYDPLSKTASVGHLTVSIDLGVICIHVWREMMTFDEL